MNYEPSVKPLTSQLYTCVCEYVEIIAIKLLLTSKMINFQNINDILIKILNLSTILLLKTDNRGI